MSIMNRGGPSTERSPPQSCHDRERAEDDRLVTVMARLIIWVAIPLALALVGAVLFVIVAFGIWLLK